MIAVNTQTIIFLQAILMGAVFGAVYDLFRIFRIAVPLPAGVIVAEDVIYFAFCGFMSFFLAMTVNFGQVRFFILLGELLGFLLYYLTLGVLVMKCAAKKAVQKNRKHLQTRRILLYNYFKNRGAISPKKRKIFRRKK